MILIITVTQAVLSILLMATILVQAKGSGLGTAWGGGGEFHSSRRGVEKALLIFTIILSGLFFITAIVNFLLF